MRLRPSFTRQEVFLALGILLFSLLVSAPAHATKAQLEKAKALYDDVKTDEAEKILRKIFDESTDKNLLAEAHMLMALIEGLVKGDMKQGSNQLLMALFLNPDVPVDQLRMPPPMQEEFNNLKKKYLALDENQLLKEALDQFDNLDYHRARTLFQRVGDVGKVAANRGNALKYVALTYLIIEKDYGLAEAEFKKAMKQDPTVTIDQDRTPPHLAKVFDLVQREFKLQLSQSKDQQQKQEAEAKIQEMEASLKAQREKVQSIGESEEQKAQMAKLKEKEEQLASLIKQQEEAKKSLSDKEKTYQNQLSQLKQQQGEQQALLDEYKSVFGSGATAEQASLRPLEKNQLGFYEHEFKNGHIMIFIPAGKFQMGTDGGAADEKPVHEVYLDGYWIDKFELTNRQFQAFVDATKYKTVAEKAGWGGVFQDGSWKRVPGADWKHPTGPDSSIQRKETLPVVQIAWEDASAYAKWIEMRLPTEAEWENAAKGDVSGPGKVGDAQIPLYSTLVASSQGTDSAYYKNGFGLANMMGNAWEWLQDKYDAGYYEQKEGYNPAGPTDKTLFLQAVRGGFPSPSKNARVTLRNKGLSGIRQDNLGFRCAVSFQTE